jgi:hypothetical protein
VDKDYSQTLKGSHNELGLNNYHHRKENKIKYQIYLLRLTEKRKTKATHIKSLDLQFWRERERAAEMRGGLYYKLQTSIPIPQTTQPVDHNLPSHSNQRISNCRNIKNKIK